MLMNSQVQRDLHLMPLPHWHFSNHGMTLMSVELSPTMWKIVIISITVQAITITNIHKAATHRQSILMLLTAIIMPLTAIMLLLHTIITMRNIHITPRITLLLTIHHTVLHHHAITSLLRHPLCMTIMPKLSHLL